MACMPRACLVARNVPAAAPPESATKSAIRATIIAGEGHRRQAPGRRILLFIRYLLSVAPMLRRPAQEPLKTVVRRSSRQERASLRSFQRAKSALSAMADIQ